MIKVYKDPIYCGQVTLISNNTPRREVKAWAKKNIKRPDRDKFLSGLETAFAICMMYPNDEAMTYVMMFCEDNPTPELVAHETMHLIQYIFEDIEIPLSRDTLEVYGYHMGYWVKTIHEFLDSVKQQEQ